MKKLFLIIFIFGIFFVNFAPKEAYSYNERYVDAGSTFKPTNKIFLENIDGMQDLNKKMQSSDNAADPGELITLYLEWLIRLSVVLGSILAVAMIMVGGAQYMTTDAMSGKSQGRERIKNAIMGLIFLIVGYLLFAEINPQILKLDFNYKPTENSNLDKIGPGGIEINGDDKTYEGYDDPITLFYDNDDEGGDNSDAVEQAEAEAEAKEKESRDDRENSDLDGSNNHGAGKQEISTRYNGPYKEFEHTKAGNINPGKSKTSLDEKTITALHNMNIYLHKHYNLPKNYNIGPKGANSATSTSGHAGSSMHYKKKAIDLAFPEGGWRKWGYYYYVAAVKAGFKGFGFGVGNIHVDTRDNGAWWCYIDGKTIDSSKGKNTRCKAVGRHHYNGSDGYADRSGGISGGTQDNNGGGVVTGDVENPNRDPGGGTGSVGGTNTEKIKFCNGHNPKYISQSQLQRTGQASINGRQIPGNVTNKRLLPQVNLNSHINPGSIPDQCFEGQPIYNSGKIAFKPLSSTCENPVYSNNDRGNFSSSVFNRTITGGTPCDKGMTKKICAAYLTLQKAYGKRIPLAQSGRTSSDHDAQVRQGYSMVNISKHQWGGAFDVNLSKTECRKLGKIWVENVQSSCGALRWGGSRANTPGGYKKYAGYDGFDDPCHFEVLERTNRASYSPIEIFE